MACGTEAAVDGDIGIEDADALCVTFTDVRDEFVPLANELQDDPDPSGPEAGISPFRSAAQLSALAYAPDGRAGVRLLFAPDSPS